MERGRSTRSFAFLAPYAVKWPILGQRAHAAEPTVGAAARRSPPMRVYIRPMLIALAITCAIALARIPAYAATSDLVVSPHVGAASDSFQFTYTVTLSAGDTPCATETLDLIWDSYASNITVGQTTIDCAAGSVSGVVTPPTQANTPGPHSFCVGPGESISPKACRSYVISGDPPPNTTPFASPPECSGACPTAYPTFEPDCIPTGKPVSPLCVTVTPISGPFCDDGSHTVNSPPCADAMTSTPTLEPTATAEPDPPSPVPTLTPPNPCASRGTPTPPCTTPSPTTTVSPTRTVVAPCVTRTSSPRATRTATATAAPCATATITATNTPGGDSGLHIRWGAVAIATAVVGVSGAAGGVWWFRFRG